MAVFSIGSSSLRAAIRRGNDTAMAQRTSPRRPPKTQVRRPAKKPPALPEDYWHVTHRPLQCLVFLLPMVLAYEIGMAFWHERVPPDLRPTLAAQQLLRWFFSLFGVTGYYLPGAALIAVLLVTHVACRYPWRVKGGAIVGMAGESVLLAIPLLFLNEWLPSLQSAANRRAANQGTLRDQIDNLLLSIGAGLYEELVFRLIVITLVCLLVIDIARVNPATGTALAVIISSILFSAHHYRPIGSDPWSLQEFAFRAAAGGYLAAVFVLRGFGLAVGCHVTYDVIAFLL